MQGTQIPVADPSKSNVFTNGTVVIVKPGTLIHTPERNVKPLEQIAELKLKQKSGAKVVAQSCST